MKMTYVAVLGGALGLAASGFWAVGCSSDDSSTPGVDGGSQPDQFAPGVDAGGGDTSTPPADTGTAKDTGTTSDTGTTDSGSGDSGPPLSCTTYCTTILQACGAADGGVGGNAQYYDTTDCMSTCALFSSGKYGETANSLGCRQYHADLAASTDPVVHCPHAGAGGGGLCGARCDDYCSLAMAHCSAANGADPPYASQADCLAACNGYPYQADASDYDPNLISTLNCLDYHLRESLSDLAGQGIDGGHCDDLSIDGGTVRGACHP
ncbi:MAG TPA: hypothetical protein VGI39_12495 [Polyangiaceae bacterium]